ncbi:NAD(P)/FAD-dependent oxidoreductase [Deinococcus roseus]|uniref:Glycine oxidase ThiO n=1 Tax=Deinococcus roseus TaxID=392414 RepID=A0ABQ2CUC4_9DEIO|nr:FAD-dependent oxidoreductase [Deinococcus roseus]GGJ21146.1 glycine oxidase ThiO [Deinococcus roseus]
MKTEKHVMVVGAGIVGSMIAVQLLDLGWQVTLLDAGFAGQATRASGGMLAPTSEAHSLPVSWREKAQLSLQLWKTWLERFERMGLDVGYISSLAHAATHLQEAEQFKSNLQSAGQWTEDNPEHPHGMAFYSEEGSLDPVQVLRALHALVPVTQAEVKRLWEDGHTIKADTSSGELQADGAVLACGAWSNRFGIPVQSRQGQALLLEGEHVDHATYKGRGYMVPRQGATYVGATEIDTWDTTPTHGARSTLLAYVQQHKPDLQEVRVLDHKVGLRPLLPEPMIAPHPSLQNVLVATGHHRNGILLAPVTAQRVMQLFMQESPPSYGVTVH